MLTSTTAAGLVTYPVIVMVMSEPLAVRSAKISSIGLPESEGGQVIIDNSWETMNGNDLRNHLTGF